MFSTRADPVVNLAYLVTLAAPFAAFLSLRLIRIGKHNLHRRAQIALLTVCILAVIALEVRIRVAGGAEVLVSSSVYAGSRLLTWVAAVHIIGAVITYLLWIGLVLVSNRSYRSSLPGSFSRIHRTGGWLIIGGLSFTTVSATLVYFLAFMT